MSAATLVWCLKSSEKVSRWLQPVTCDMNHYLLASRAGSKDFPSDCLEDMKEIYPRLFKIDVLTGWETLITRNNKPECLSGKMQAFFSTFVHLLKLVNSNFNLQICVTLKTMIADLVTGVYGGVQVWLSWNLWAILQCPEHKQPWFWLSFKFKTLRHHSVMMKQFDIYTNIGYCC